MKAVAFKLWVNWMQLVQPHLALDGHRGAVKQDVELISLVALPHDVGPGLERDARALLRQQRALVRVELSEQRDALELALEPQRSDTSHI
jgi:hypothetical protein